MGDAVTSPVSNATNGAADTDDIAVGITIGSTGQVARWTVSPWGAVTPWGQESPETFDWFLAADDRWHIPAQEPTIRQTRIEGAPVIETRMRIPDGDAVQRVWAVPNGEGNVIVEFENESPMPFAVAVTGGGVVTDRPPADVPIQGIELPEGAIVLPVGHRAIVRVAIPFPGGAGPQSLSAVPPASAVVSGWLRVVQQASRLVLPDERLVEALVAARCDLLLEGPIDGASDPVGFLLDVAELVRCGDSAEAWMLDIVEPAERVAKQAGRRGASEDDAADALAALGACRLVAMRAGDDRAARDVDRTMSKLAKRHGDIANSAGSAGAITSFADVRRGSSVGRFVRSIERRVADGGRLLPGGIPNLWLGSNFEVHGLPTSPRSTVSFAVRWHGERPAVLWEQDLGADPTDAQALIELSAPDIDPEWTTTEASGEALWPAPAKERARSSLSITVDPEGGSFV
ncbi:MAG: hypothetical protein AB8G26_04760 [Ilumatobacter sp.]